MIDTDNTTVVAYTNKQEGTHSRALLRGSVPMATNSRHSHLGQTHSGLSKHYSRPQGGPKGPECVLAKPAHNNRVESPPRNSDPDLRDVGTPTVDMFATVHNTHLPQFMSPISEPRALAIDTLSQDWQWRLMFMFPLFPMLSKVIQKLRTTQKGKVILIAPWWPSQPCLASVLSRTGMAAAVQAKTMSDMITSMELQRPRMTPVPPQWDLDIILETLSKPPYVPLREASLKHLTLKTFFLLAMASAGRRSELQALVFDKL